MFDALSGIFIPIFCLAIAAPYRHTFLYPLWPARVAVAAALVLFGVVGAVHAQALPAPGTSPVFPITQSGNVWTFGPGSATSANAASLTFGNAANGAVYAEGSASLGVGGGRFAPVAVRALPAAANVAKAVGNMALRWTGVLGVGIALYDLAKELGFNVDSSSGAVTVTKSDPTICTVAPCYLKKLASANYGTYTGNTVAQAAAAMQSGYNAQGLDYLIASYSVSGNSATFIENKRSTGAYYTTRVISASDVPTSPSSPVLLPSTLQELADAIASQSGWPSGSAIGRALTDAVAKGEVVPLPQPSTITGPASIPLAPSIVTRPDGSSTVTQPNKLLTYSPPTVTSTDSSTVTDRDAAGNPIAPPTTETKPSELPQTCGYPGGPPCKIDESGTPANPIQSVDTDLHQVKQDAQSLREKIAGTSDKAWSWTLLGAPPLTACEAIPMPVVVGKQIPSIDPCSTVEGIRAFMAWVWAFLGFGLCISMIREVI